MSQRNLFRDVSSRNSSFVCQSCLLSLGRPSKASPNPWTVRHGSSQASALGTQQQQTRGRRAPRTAARTPKQSPTNLLPLTQNATSTNEGAAAKLFQELTKPKDEPSFRFYEEDDKGVKELSGQEAFSDSLNGVGEIENKMKLGMAADMRELLDSLKEDKGLRAMGVGNVGSLAQEFEAKLGDLDNTEGLGERLDAYIKELESELETQGEVVDKLDKLEDINLDEDDPDFLATPVVKPKQARPIPQIPADAWTYNQRRRLSKLNAVLDRVGKELRRREPISPKTVQSVWKTYNLARQTLAKSWGQIPADVWDLLWKILSIEAGDNSHRFTYLSMLARDMSEAKVALNPAQQLVAMEAMFVDGFDAKAIDNWKRCMTTLGDGGAETFQEFWELGVRMFCQAGDLVQADRAVSKLLERQLDPRILVPYIRSCASRTDEESREKAWDAYRRMRDLLGPSMEIEDYDQVISFWLTTNQTERALFAFVDMMTSGAVDLGARTRTHLPSQIGNKFFFGKWLKRLIGAGDLEGAHSVYEFMRARGIEAATIQMNGLVGAYQRSGGSEDLEKADELAWSMIRARIGFVEARRRFSGLDAKIQPVERQTARPEGRETPTPKATLETFSLLAENYRVRRLQKPMEELWDAFRAAEISPDAFMLNQLMESHSQFGNVPEARGLYASLVRERGVRPDPYTFMALWKMLGANRLQTIGHDRVPDETRLTRDTFAEMVRFRHVFGGESLDGKLARKILHTFRRLGDGAGAIVALRTFRAVFDYLPPEVLALEMAVGTTNLAWDRPSARQKLRIAKRRMDAHVEARQRGLGLEVVALEKMTGPQRGEAMLDYMEEVFAEGIPDVGVALAEAAREMGVYDIVDST